MLWREDEKQSEKGWRGRQGRITQALLCHAKGRVFLLQAVESYLQAVSRTVTWSEFSFRKNIPLIACMVQLQGCASHRMPREVRHELENTMTPKSRHPTGKPCRGYDHLRSPWNEDRT